MKRKSKLGICSVEEIGSFAEPTSSSFRESKKLPPQPVNGKNGNYGGPKVRDRLCQLIRQHQLDAPRQKPERVIADAGYDSDPLRQRLRARGIELIAPYRKNNRKRRYEDGRKLRRYRRRWIVERTNAWLGQFSQVAGSS